MKTIINILLLVKLRNSNIHFCEEFPIHMVLFINTFMCHISEKQALSIIPGKELKPSGYLEFLEKHQGQEWTSLNPNKFTTNSTYSLESRSTQEPASVAYDDQYDSFSTSKLGFIADNQFEGQSHNGYDQVTIDKTRVGQSIIVTSLTRVSANGEEVNTVFTSAKGHLHKGIANSSERKGTIAYQPIEVQTDALSPVSERELLSSELPKSDIIVDGHDNTSVSHEQTCYSEVDQNYSPIYASMDTINIDTNDDTETEESSASYTELLKINHTHHSESGSLEVETGVLNSVIHFNSELSDVNHDISRDQFAISEQTVGFHDNSDEALDESDINMYLSELDEGKVGDFSSSKTTDACTLPVQLHYPNQNDLNHVEGSKTRSLADELSEAEPETDPYSRSHSHLESLPKKFRSDDTGARSVVIPDHQDPDLVAGLRPYPQSESKHFHNGSHESSTINGSYIKSIDKNLCSVKTGDKHAVFNTLISGKMEIETILDNKNKTSSDSICDDLLRGKMEIEGILDEVVLNQQNELGDGAFSKYLSQKPNHLNSSHNHVDMFTAASKPCVITGHETNSTHSSNSNVSYSVLSTVGVGARPKDPSVIKKNRPNSLLGLSKVTLDIPAVVKAETVLSSEELPHQQTAYTDVHLTNTALELQSHLIHQDSGTLVQDSPTRLRAHCPGVAEPHIKPVIHDFSQPFDQSKAEQRNDQSTFRAEGLEQDASQAAGSQKMKRPTSLNLPARPEFSIGQAAEEDMDHEGKLRV